MSTKEKSLEKPANGQNGTSHHASEPQTSYWVTLSLVFGGCCGNAWSLENLLMKDTSFGSALTILQMTFVVLYYLPNFLRRRPSSFLPRMTTPVVPITHWTLQVVVLLGVNIFNNWTFAYKIPLTLQIVFRSSGLAVSMLFGYLFLNKRYNTRQGIAVVLVTVGVVVATVSRPTPANVSTHQQDVATYVKGVTVMMLSILLSGALGALQEQTYKQYGSQWKEGVFYTHALALPAFFFISNDIGAGFEAILRHAKPSQLGIPAIYLVVAANVITQGCCVSGVNRLASTTSSVQTSLLLTARKAFSLIFSILWFGNGWNWAVVFGGVLVSAGTLLYSSAKPVPKIKTS